MAAGESREACAPSRAPSPELAPSSAAPAWQCPGSHASMALLVHLKTVSELRGRGDRIAKVTFRGREAPVFWGPQVWADGLARRTRMGWKSSCRAGAARQPPASA